MSKCPPSLHVHDYFSLLDGVPSPSSYFERCDEIGMEKIALTNHGNMGSLAEASIECKNFKVRPIMGMEAYVVSDVDNLNALRESKSSEDKEALKDFRSSFHAVLLCKNQKGYQNLVKINNRAWTDGFYYRPRTDFNHIFKHKEGLVCLSACQSGIVSKFIIDGKHKQAIEVAKRMKKEFGDNFYLELQFLDMEIQDKLNKALVQLGRKLDIPFILTSDAHYVRKGDHRLQSILIDLATKGDFSMDSSVNFLKTLEDHEKDFRIHKSVPRDIFTQAIDNCFKIGDECNFVVETGKLYFPEYDHKMHFLYSKFPISNRDKFFLKIIIYRAKKMLREKLNNKIYQERLLREYQILKKLGGISYFLICDDLLNYVREQGAFSMIRGSANGSLIAFVFGFGLIDPIEHSIMFERFVSEHRSLNDIDIDIDVRSEFRSKAIDYLRNRFGKDRVISVGTYNRMQLKGAIKDVTRVLKDRIDKKLLDKDFSEKKVLKKKREEYLFPVVNRITSIMAGDLSLKEARSSYEIFNTWYLRNEKMMKRYVEPIIGNIKNVSLHPAGIVITPRSVDELLPIRTQVNPHNKSERVVSTVWENSHTSREDLNEIGVMVLDVLGVKTLSVVSEVIDLVKKIRGIDINLYELNLRDKKTLKMFNKGELIGVFQFSGGAASNIVRNTRITEFNDLIVINALARPGALMANADKIFAARKEEKSLVRYDHHSLENILGDSLGVLVFSEHILRTASEFAGMDPKRADSLRKIIKGKNPKAFKEYKKEFIKGAMKKWPEEKDIKRVSIEIWNKFSKAGSYLFPRGHASSYALLGFICQYLKVHYPIEFFTCHLRYSTQDKYSEIKKIAETVYGIKFILPNISTPVIQFEASERGIRWPITALKQVGDKAAQAIIEKVPFISFEDFFVGVNKQKCNKKVVENLIIAGAFKDFGKKKAIYNLYNRLRKAKESETQNPAFLSKENMISAMESVFGFEIVSLEKVYSEKLKPFLKILSSREEFDEFSSGEQVVAFGRIERLSKVKTKNGDEMAFLDLKNKNQEFNITLFPDVFNLIGDRIKQGKAVVISGVKNIWNGKSSIVLQTVKTSKTVSLSEGSWLRNL